MPMPYATHRAQLEAILKAWGMPDDNAAATAEVMAWADLHATELDRVRAVFCYLRDGGAAGDHAPSDLLDRDALLALLRSVEMPAGSDSDLHGG